MDLRLELVPVPVRDIEAKPFDADQIGFLVDPDVAPAEGVRVVQLTPPGSACSIVLAEVSPLWRANPVQFEGFNSLSMTSKRLARHGSGRHIEVEHHGISSPGLDQHPQLTPTTRGEGNPDQHVGRESRSSR